MLICVVRLAPQIVLTDEPTPLRTHLLFDLGFVTMSSTMDESMSVLPGESGSVAELLGSSESLGQSGSGAPADAATASALTAAFNFTGTSASANGATMQEYFVQSVLSSAQKFELLTTRLRGLCREWTEFCDQEISFQLSGDDRGDGNVTRTVSATPSGAAGVLTTAAHTSSNPSVSVRIRRSLLASAQLSDRKLCMLRYLGAVETDKLVSRRSCLEVPVAGPMVHFLQELGFDPEFTYVAQGQIFIRGRVKACVYTVNEVTQFENSAGSVSADGSVTQDPLPKEWRRLCPRSWMVEISAVGSPADESLQEEVVDFADMLHPLVVPAKVDHSVLTRK
ncbi:mediator of RNA polymerase II transcription subunit 18 [Paragonimus westermani]|uniref:Mediator of RNA polymerase II transcription subunit 18 n=1 Tax=Paragonimus westermani TaxID=34504 RepID=A0A5J4NS49_9TREM|nr:mediator of RNA polymerase II transcription subunit 18 [Paragonimus westermani]